MTRIFTFFVLLAENKSVEASGQHLHWAWRIRRTCIVIYQLDRVEEDEYANQASRVVVDTEGVVGLDGYLNGLAQVCDIDNMAQ